MVSDNRESGFSAGGAFSAASFLQQQPPMGAIKLFFWLESPRSPFRLRSRSFPLPSTYLFSLDIDGECRRALEDVSFKVDRAVGSELCLGVEKKKGLERIEN